MKILFEFKVDVPLQMYLTWKYMASSENEKTIHLKLSQTSEGTILLLFFISQSLWNLQWCIYLLYESNVASGHSLVMRDTLLQFFFLTDEWSNYMVGWFMVFNATFNNTSVISWWSVLLVEETKVPEVKPPICRKSLTNFIT